MSRAKRGLLVLLQPPPPSHAPNARGHRVKGAPFSPGTTAVSVQRAATLWSSGEFCVFPSCIRSAEDGDGQGEEGGNVVRTPPTPTLEAQTSTRGQAQMGLCLQNPKPMERSFLLQYTHLSLRPISTPPGAADEGGDGGLKHLRTAPEPRPVNSK